MEKYDVIVVGSGHAGCEAALAAARMGCRTLLLTLNIENIALMACNPSVGGPAKAHLVREIDALGGEIARNIDKSYIQIRMLNTKKGPAVRALRAQADKQCYHQEMKLTIESQDGLDLRQTIVEKILVSDGCVYGVQSNTGTRYIGDNVIIASGTYLGGKIHIGETNFESGPYGQYAASALSRSLREHGFELFRFKTGTPPRLDGKTIDFKKLEEQKGDNIETGFSFWSDIEVKNKALCWLLETTEETHEIIRDNISKAPMYSGAIVGIGPRYCPSIESKVMGFPHHNSHVLFLEPETIAQKEFYLAGFSTSLPEDVQLKMLKTLQGFADIKVTRFGYAIEYDVIDPTELNLSLESKRIQGLFFAGQVNGSSGYEEAAAQGLMAGINAARRTSGKPPVILDRSEAYIGVLIDDLVTKGTNEPYRTMTARAEYRLWLRQDNADQRLSHIGYDLGLISEDQYDSVKEKEQIIGSELSRLEEYTITPTASTLQILRDMNESPIYGGVSLAELLKRPTVKYGDLEKYGFESRDLPRYLIQEVEVKIKYDGYLKKQEQEIARFKRMEKKLIPVDIDYVNVPNISLESREKFEKVRPVSIGQASRISGVSPADISALLLYLKILESRREN